MILANIEYLTERFGIFHFEPHIILIFTIYLPDRLPNKFRFDRVFGVKMPKFSSFGSVRVRAIRT